MATLQRVVPARSYWEDRVFPVTALLGIGTVMFALAAGVLAALYVGDLFPAQAQDPAQNQGAAGAINAWTRPVGFFGLSLLMTSVVLVLRGIAKTLTREQGEAFTTYLPRLIGKGGN